jgi:integrase
VRIYTHCRCDKNGWDKKTKRVSSGRDKDKINIQLNDYENLVLELFDEYENYPTVGKLREDIQARIIMPEKPQSIYERFDEYIETNTRKKSWTVGTSKRIRVCKKHLYAFSPDITFQELTETKLLSFVEYQQGLPLINTTVQKNIKILKSFLKWAAKEGYNKNDAYRTFDLKLKGTNGKANKVIALNWDELMTVEHLTIPETKNYLKTARDVFVFQCFTGLRYSDVFNLRRHNINGDSIEIVTVKTDDRLTIPLNDYSRAILARYRDINFEDDKVLPVISNQKMNEYLKELGELAGFTQKITIVKYVGEKAVTTVLPKSELISTHTARRTFVSIGSYLNIPYEVLASWTGHSSETMMAKYREINEGKAKLEMEKINKQ